MSKKDILTTTLPTTNVVLNQDLKTGHFNITELFKQCNGKNGTNKRLDRYLDLDSTKELIEYRKNKLKSHIPKLTDGENQELTEKQEKEVSDKVIKTVKGKLTKEGRTPDRTTADAVITLDAASYLDIELRNEIYEYFLDDKRSERLNLRENYKKLSGLVRNNIGDTREIFSDLVHNINGIVFDRFVSDLWNDETTKEQYQEINHIIIKLIGLIEDGNIKTVSVLNNKLMQWYNKKYPNNFKQSIQN